MGAYVLVECPSLDASERHVATKPRRGATGGPFERGRGQRGMKDNFGQRVDHNVGD